MPVETERPPVEEREDEELTLLMRYQQACQAASRLVNVADEMMQTLLTMAN